MKFKTLLNGAILFTGLGLVAYSFLVKGLRLRFNVESIPVEEEQKHKQVFEIYQLKENSVYDGDTLRVQRNGEELKIRLCGIDSPEIKQPMGIEARDHLRLRSAQWQSQSLANINNGELWLIPIEKDRHGRTVTEVS